MTCRDCAHNRPGQRMPCGSYLGQHHVLTLQPGDCPAFHPTCPYGDPASATPPDGDGLFERERSNR
jgi:hypothetical protein